MSCASKTTDAAVYECQPNDVAKKDIETQNQGRSKSPGNVQAMKCMKRTIDLNM